jgi:drug/metabolite transporter (DMT)-like permease
VWILSFTPLSRAYPFLALSFVITPLAGSFFFGERLSAGTIGGLALIMGGLYLIASRP